MTGIKRDAVEYFTDGGLIVRSNLFKNITIVLLLKVNPKDNTITIKKVKDSLTREDLTILNQIIPLDSDFTNAKIGDKVTYLNHSFGEIVDINKNSKYPIACQMGGSTFTFTLDGKFSTQDIIPALVKGHHAEIILCTKP